ncbi:unnamed protein product [Caenorhabditis angaria]|uniref:Uncharacterized protein n=1 Tax=Caenorhabditis angaria TaxID=860376 RepID=A0A9P1IVZ2_9PELO|nr:unnamed protein product [Caenorhabditis angaria]
MSEKEAIASLEKQLAEQSANFEKWKIENSRQRGTPSYNDYIVKFGDWEREIRAKIAEHQGHLPESGPKNVDSILDDLLDNVGIYEFMFALANIHMNDKTFIPSFVQEFQKNKRIAAGTEPSLVVPAAQFYPTHSATPYSYTAPPQQSATTMHSWSRPAQMPIQRSTVSPIRDFQKKNTGGAPFRDFSV